MALLDTKGGIILILILIAAIIIIFELIKNLTKNIKPKKIKSQNQEKNYEKSDNNQEQEQGINIAEKNILRKLHLLRKTRDGLDEKLEILKNLTREYMDKKTNENTNDLSEVNLEKIKDKDEMSNYLKILALEIYSIRNIEKNTLEALMNRFEKIIRAEMNTEHYPENN